MNFAYRFPAVRGIQSHREYYISMVPMKLLVKLFPEEEESLLPEYRAQRKINELSDYFALRKAANRLKESASTRRGKQ